MTSAQETVAEAKPALKATPLACIAAMIPAWQPEPALISIVQELCDAGFAEIIVVDDGSSVASSWIFEHLYRQDRVHVVRHAVNLGKGRALKTGINHFLTNFPHLDGLVTADADGQHAPEDIVRAAMVFAESGEDVVLGSRYFSDGVPFRSRFGNILTRYIFLFITGRRLIDTQTGLRIFPAGILPGLLCLDGERYEYEMTVLAKVCESRKPVEVPIRVIYTDGNRSSHFDPIRDSMRIYFVLLRFYLSSIFAAAIDMIGFALGMWLTGNVAVSFVVGRLSSLANFALNKRFVFNNAGSIRGPLLRYYLLVVTIALTSYGAIGFLSGPLHWNVFAAKVSVETLLSLISFSVQRTFVFRQHTTLKQHEVLQ